MILYGLLCAICICGYNSTVRCPAEVNTVDLVQVLNVTVTYFPFTSYDFPSLNWPKEAEIPCEVFSPAAVRIDFGASECFKVESMYRGNCSRVKSVTWCRQSQTPEPLPEPSTSNNIDTISWYYLTHFTWVDVAVITFLLHVYLWIEIEQNKRRIRKPARLYIYRKRRNPNNDDDTTPSTDDVPNVDKAPSVANDNFEEIESDSSNNFLGQHDFEENERDSCNDLIGHVDL